MLHLVLSGLKTSIGFTGAWYKLTRATFGLFASTLLLSSGIRLSLVGSVLECGYRRG